MSQATEKRILRRVYSKCRGWAFSQNDLTDFGSHSALNVAPHRLCANRGSPLLVACQITRNILCWPGVQPDDQWVRRRHQHASAGPQNRQPQLWRLLPVARGGTLGVDRRRGLCHDPRADTVESGVRGGTGASDRQCPPRPALSGLCRPLRCAPAPTGRGRRASGHGGSARRGGHLRSP